MTTILVTGGAGFIGSNFIRYILNKHKDIKIINLDKLTYAGNLENLKDLENNPNYKFIKGDICDTELINEITKDIDEIIHFAAESHVDNSIENPFIFTKTNITGTHILLEAAKNNNIKKFIHISTDEVYGSIKEGSFKETDILEPNSPYSASKAGAEHIVRAYNQTFNLPTIITRTSNNYGPYQYPEKLISLFITNLIENKKVPVYGEGLNIREWTHVIDNCEAIDVVRTKGDIGEIYNIGTNNEIPNIEITKIILKLMNKDETNMEFVKDRLGHDFRYSINCDKIKKLGWGPKITFEQGLKETVDWYKNNQEWWKKLKKKTILILGANGMLGSDLKETFKDQNLITKGSELDITDKQKLSEEINKIKPDIIINSAAYTDVDGCETNIEKATETNGNAIKHIAEICKEKNITLVHYSTDYVFDGEKQSYNEDDQTNPINQYGKSKLVGENNAKIANKHYIIRTSWLFGKNGKNFITTMINLAKTKSELRVVSDQIGSPTYTKDLANKTKEILTLPYGTYHITNNDSCSWFELAKKTLELKNIETPIHPITTNEFPTPAKRPKFSILNNTKTTKMRNWTEAVEDYLKNEN